MKKFMEEFNKKWEELKKKNEENKNTVKCENSENNQDGETDEDKKSPFKFRFQVCSRASAKAVACSNEEAQPASGKNFLLEQTVKSLRCKIQLLLINLSQ